MVIHVCEIGGDGENGKDCLEVKFGLEDGLMSLKRSGAGQRRI